MTSLIRRLGRRVKRTLFPPTQITPTDSFAQTPWDHPYLTSDNLRRFRSYSGAIWDFAGEYRKRRPEPLDLGFSVNLAQTAYKWACLSQEYGAKATLYLHPHDHNAQSMPEWEEYDGDFPNVYDGDDFLAAHGNINLRCPCMRIPLDREPFNAASAVAGTWDRRVLHRALGQPPRDVRWEAFVVHSDYAPYFPLAQALARHDAIVAPSIPIPAYLSGAPYLAQSVGGDLQFDCGRADHYGLIMTLAFSAARFITHTNPHTVGFFRRLGFTNGLYLPYVMDDDRYCPGPGRARKEWVAQHGEGVYVLSAARIDNAVKGNGDDLLGALVRAAKERPALRYVFLQWGKNAEEFKGKVNATGAASHFIFLKPVGKTRLIDYLRSCDAVLDQFLYGAYGATGLEAAGAGKPILMRLDEQQLGPLYQGDIAPMVNLPNADALARALVRLVDEPDWHQGRGQELRAWMVRNHGAKRMMPILLSLARLAADRVRLPAEIAQMNPLTDPLGQDERVYHAKCERPRPDLVKKSR